MANTRREQRTTEKVLKENEDSEENRAKIACFLISQDKQKYALVSNHAIVNTDGNVYIRKPLSPCNLLGACCINENTSVLDVGLIKLEKNIRDCCINEIIDPKGHKRTWKVFQGNIESLCDSQVFKCIPLDDRKSNRTKWKTPLIGKVASVNVHKQHRNTLGNCLFLVASDDLMQFAIEGESGTLLAADVGNSDVYLIGVIAGLLRKDCPQKFIICVFLPSAFECLTELVNSDFVVYSSALEAWSSEIDTITCGSTIFFKGIENVGKLDFEIEKQICNLFNIDFKNEDNSSIERIYECERQFRQKVFAREQFTDMVLFEADRAEKVVLSYFYLTVDHLYKQNNKKAEYCLKEGIRCLSKAQQSCLRLLCKCVTYVTWLFLNTDEQEKLKTILEEGLEFYKENEHLPHFPKECLGYHYYDFSRFHVNKHHKDNAINMAKLGYDYLEGLLQDAKKDKSRENFSDVFNRYVFAVCQLGEALLWCGENFEYAEEDIPEDDIAKAASVIETIESRINDAPAVQKVQYYLAKCDICFRKHDFESAFKYADTCQKLAKQHDLEEEQSFAGKRCVALRKKNKCCNKKKIKTASVE